MTRGVVTAGLVVAAVLVLAPAPHSHRKDRSPAACATRRAAVMPGVTVEVTSPALIEKVRSAVTDTNGQYRITNLPVGTYTVTFTLAGFTTQQRDNIVLTTGFTAPVNATMSVGQLAETVVVAGVTPTVDVQNARQAITFEGADLKELPTPQRQQPAPAHAGISSNYRQGRRSAQPGVCVGGIGVFCNPGLTGFNVGDTGQGFLVNGIDPTGVSNTNLHRAACWWTARSSTPAPGCRSSADRRLHRRHRARAGNQHPGVGCARRVGDRRRLHQHRSPHGRQPLRRRLQHDLHPRRVVRPQHRAPTRSVPALFQAVKSDHDMSARLRRSDQARPLWFFAQARDQGIHKLPVGVDFWPNLHEGKSGFNYQPDRAEPRVEYRNKWKNVSAPLHVAGDAAEQVQHLLGRAGLLPGPV